MKIYKLKYTDKETAIADLIAKGVYVETEQVIEQDAEQVLSYGQGVHAIVEIGKIILENGTYDEEGNEITPPIYADGYHYDVMSEQEIEFKNEVFTKNPKHTFNGF